MQERDIMGQQLQSETLPCLLVMHLLHVLPHINYILLNEAAVRLSLQIGPCCHTLSCCYRMTCPSAWNTYRHRRFTQPPLAMAVFPSSLCCPAGEAADGDDEAEGACVGGLARTLRQRLEEERKKTEEAEAELDRQRASNAGLGASVSRLEGQLAAKKAFWEVGALDVLSAGLHCSTDTEFTTCISQLRPRSVYHRSLL